MDDVRDILTQAKKALEFSSMSLASIENYDGEEDMASESRANKTCMKINQQAIAKIDSYLSKAGG